MKILKLTYWSLLILLIYTLSIQNAYAQLEAKNWYFGILKAMKFENDSIVKLFDSKMLSDRGGSCISDKNGNLLFYGNRNGKVYNTGFLYNKNHDTLKNSDGYYYSTGADQTPIIIPMPENPNKYYLFTLIAPRVGLPDSVKGLWYHIVDISKDNGKGEMILKNKKICDNVTEQISATFHADKKSVWIMVREYNTNNFKTYLLKNTGLDNTPVISSAGTVINNINWIDGQMKFSASGVKIANTMSRGAIVDICNFDNNTGKVTAISTLSFDTNYTHLPSHWLYGCEFSPNEKYLYVSGFGSPGYLFQVDISSGIESVIQNSIDTIYQNYNTMGDGNNYLCLQIGIDKKIYVARPSYYLGRINNPDEKGRACNYEDSAIYFSTPGFVGMSLPTFLQSYFYLPDIEIRNTCLGDSTAFNLADTTNIDSVLWKFGDGDSVIEISPKHVYADTGFYQTKAIIFYDNTSDTFEREIRISNYAYPNFGIADSSQCLLGNEFQFYDSSYAVDGAMTYEWDFGDSSGSFFPNPTNSYLTADTFSVTLTVTSSYGCESSATKNVYVRSMPIAEIGINDTSQCFNENSFTFFNPQDSLNPATSKTWYFGDGNTNNKDTALHSYSFYDTFEVTLIEETSFGCRDTAKRDVVVHPSPKAGFSFNDSAQCFNQQLLVARNSSLVASDSIIENRWILNNDTVISEDLTNYTFDKYGTYPIELIVTTSNNCRDTFASDFVLHPSPLANFTVNDSTQCFNSQSLVTSQLSMVVGDSITETKWILNNDTILANEITNYSFDDFGTYPVKLVVSTSNNCKDSITKNIDIYEVPIAGFSINDSIQCFNENNFVLTNQSQFSDLSKLNHWWDMGDMTIINNTDVTYSYSTNDTFTIILETRTPKGCKDTVSKQVIILPSPKAKFGFSDSTQCFNEQSLDISNLSLVVGDTIIENRWILNSDTILSNEITNYQFNQPGTYPIQLIVTTSNNCPDTFSSYFILHPSPLANFTVNDSVQCFNEQDFQITNLSTINNDIITQNSWYLNSQLLVVSSSQDLPVTNPGTSQLKLITTSSHNCPDSITKELIIYPSPKANFSHELPCLDIPNQFTDQSTIQTPGIINQWYWEFGDGNLESTQNPTNTFTASGTYKIFFVAISDKGCPDTATKDLQFYEHFGAIELERATVVNDQYIQIDWKTNSQGNPQKIVLEKSLDNNNYSFIDSFELSDNTYNDHQVKVDDFEYWYRLFSVDHCKHQSEYSNIGKAVLLSIDTLNQENSISWSAYKEWQNGVSGYTLEFLMRKSRFLKK